MVWLRALGLTLPIAATCGLENTQGKGKIKIYTCACPEENEEESAALAALTVDGDCLLDFYLKRDSYDSGHCKTNKVFSVLIDGKPGWLGHK